MASSHHIAQWPSEADRRAARLTEQHDVAGLPCRDADIETTRGLASVAKLFRVMAGVLVLLGVLQAVNGLTSSVPISFGVMAAELIRLLIVAAILWGAGDLADCLVKSY